MESTPGKRHALHAAAAAQPPQTAASRFPSRHRKHASRHGESNRIPVPEGNKVTVLVAEDNEQFRTFMKDLLGQDFTVLTAVDGQEGLAMAREYGPDLIISDVMMPHMDGYAFAVRSRTTCSAATSCSSCSRPKNSSESRSGAYEAGADSFIAKTVRHRRVHSRIRQLLEQRERRLASFRKGTHINPKEITITSLDEKLIQKGIGMHRKEHGQHRIQRGSPQYRHGIRTLLTLQEDAGHSGQTPTEFMRSIRLKRAARLLGKRPIFRTGNFMDGRFQHPALLLFLLQRDVQHDTVRVCRTETGSSLLQRHEDGHDEYQGQDGKQQAARRANGERKPESFLLSVYEERHQAQKRWKAWSGTPE